MIKIQVVLTITPIGNASRLWYFYEYNDDSDIEIGWADDGSEVSVIIGRFKVLAKSKGMELIVKTLPIQSVAPVIIEAVAESVGEPEPVE